jgi:phosphate/sulfate permease
VPFRNIQLPEGSTYRTLCVLSGQMVLPPYPPNRSAKESDLTKEDVAVLNNYKRSLDDATKFIPFWVKIAVAIALGLGTMIGWKRVVVTVAKPTLPSEGVDAMSRDDLA